LAYNFKDKDGQNVYDEDGELMIHTDGTGFISEDLANRCPRRISKGRDTTPKDFKVRDSSNFCCTNSSTLFGVDAVTRKQRSQKI